MDTGATIAPAAIRYDSRFTHGVDDKRRVQIPARWRSEGGGDKFTLIVWTKQGVCLRALPPRKMEELIRDLDAMPNEDPSKGILKRFIGSRSVEVEVDKSGRICLPDEMTKQVGITGEAKLVGCIDKFEIWDPKRFDEIDATDVVMAQEAFKRLE